MKFLSTSTFHSLINSFIYLFSLSLSDVVAVLQDLKNFLVESRVITCYLAPKSWYVHVPSRNRPFFTYSLSYPCKLFLASDDYFVFLPLTLNVIILINLLTLKDYLG